MDDRRQEIHTATLTAEDDGDFIIESKEKPSYMEFPREERTSVFGSGHLFISRNADSTQVTLIFANPAEADAVAHALLIKANRLRGLADDAPFQSVPVAEPVAAEPPAPEDTERDDAIKENAAEALRQETAASTAEAEGRKDGEFDPDVIPF